MVKVEASKARSDFSETISRVAFKNERVVLVRSGKETAAIVPMEDLAVLEMLDRRADVRAARKALREAAKEGTIPYAQLRKTLGLK